MLEQKIDKIIEKFLQLDIKEVEIQLTAAGATSEIKDFYLKYLYPFSRRNNREFKQLYQVK